MSKVGALIRVARERRGLSARQLSAITGYSPAYVSRLESGNLDPSLRAFAKIAHALHLNNIEVMLCLAVEAMAGEDASISFEDSDVDVVSTAG